MGEGITANQLEAGVVTIFSQTVELTDAQIKTLTTVPVVIVPATEVLNYSGLPTKLPLPLAFTVSLNTLAGAYTNLDGAAFYVLAIGSDWSLNGMESDQNQMASLQNVIRIIGVANSFRRELLSDMIGPLAIQNGGLQDNALAIALHNASGEVTGGNPANSMKVTVLYTVLDV